MEPAQAQRRWVGEHGEQQVAAQRVSAEHRARFRAQFRKSELCRFYPTSCNRGDGCNFAHSPEELHRAPDLTKTSICRAWKAGHCPMDLSECSFAHGYDDLRVTTVFLKSAPCKMFLQRGRCDLGSSCRHAHNFAELRSAQSLMDRPTSYAREVAPTGRPEQDPRAERLRNPRGAPSGPAARPQHLGGVAKPSQRQGRLQDLTRPPACRSRAATCATPPRPPPAPARRPRAAVTRLRAPPTAPWRARPAACRSGRGRREERLGGGRALGAAGAELGARGRGRAARARAPGPGARAGAGAEFARGSGQHAAQILPATRQRQPRSRADHHELLKVPRRGVRALARRAARGAGMPPRTRAPPRLLRGW
ncbi:unnamed protein product, partial [Prorocentrum cordatum]